MKTYKSNEMVHANARKTWNEYFLELGKRDSRIVALTADLSRSTCTESFRKEIPRPIFQCWNSRTKYDRSRRGFGFRRQKNHIVFHSLRS